MITDITVSLPEGSGDGTRRYPLLLSLDPGLPAAEITATLTREGILPPMIVASRAGGSTESAENLITHLCATHRILEAPEARWICGTGHSAAEALRTVLRRPDLAGRAACLSTSFEGTEGAPPPHSRLLHELEERKDLPKGVKLFLDYGTSGIDECYEPYHRDAGALLRAKGWRDGREFEIRRFAGGSHDATSWRIRLGPALRWLAGR
jgi:enterochelin esterase-like enzyme